MSFNYENHGPNTYLVYELSEMEEIDSLGVGMIVNNKISGLAPTVFSQVDTKKYLKYNVSSKVSLDQFFSGTVNRYRLIKVFEGIVSALNNVEDYMIDLDAIILDQGLIFTNVSTCDVTLICLPISSKVSQANDYIMFFKNIMFTTKFDQNENCDYVAKIINYLNSVQTLNISEFKSLLESLSNTDNKVYSGNNNAAQTFANPQSNNQYQSSNTNYADMSVNPIQNRTSEYIGSSENPTINNQMNNPVQNSISQMEVNNNQQMFSSVPENKNIQNIPSQGGINIPSNGYGNGTVVNQPGANNTSIPTSIPVPPQNAQKVNPNQGMVNGVPVPPNVMNNNIPVPPRGAVGVPPMPGCGNVPPFMPGGQGIPAANIPQPAQPAKKGFFSKFGSRNEEGQETKKKEKVKKEKKASNFSAPVPPAGNGAFAIPGQNVSINAASNNAMAVNSPQSQQQKPKSYQETATNMQDNPVAQTQTNPAPSPVPMAYQQPVQTQPRPMNFGETTVLGGGAAIGETTVLGATSLEVEQKPHLIRMKNKERIPLDKPVFRIGKERSYVDYFIGDNTAISRSHANVISRDGEYYVVDTNSTNHTYVDGNMIQSNVETKIAHGTKIRLANEDFEFKLY